MRRAGWGLALLLASAAPGCLSEDAAKSARDVVTLRSGTISELRDRRGCGPFRRYELSPAAMLEVVAAAARKGRDLAGRPVEAVYVSERYGEVVAKERGPEDEPDQSYSDEWRTAVVATVHPIRGEPNASNVEIHAARRSPLMGGRNDWERDLPGWIDEALRERAAGRLPEPPSPAAKRGWGDAPVAPPPAPPATPSPEPVPRPSPPSRR